MKSCLCTQPNVDADKEGYAFCSKCQQFFNRKLWEDHHNKKIQKAISNKKIGRNCPCQCKSGLKFKKCCAVRKLVGVVIEGTHKIEMQMVCNEAVEIRTEKVTALVGMYNNNTYSRERRGDTEVIRIIGGLLKGIPDLPIIVDSELIEFAGLYEEEGCKTMTTEKLAESYNEMRKV